MTIANLPPRKKTETVDLPQHLVLEDVSWDFYEQVLKQLGDSRLKVNFDQGRLEIMAPSRNHESIKKILARVIETYTMVLNIRMVPLGSTTFKREDLSRGLEPDECYYFANAAAVERKAVVDLSVDPPPDLVVEVDISPYQLDRSSIYAALGVPEMWLYDGKRVIYAIRNENGDYVSKDKSLSLPGLTLVDVNRFVKMSLDTTHHDAVMAIFDWAQRLPANES